MREAEIQHQIIKTLEDAGWLVVKIIQTNRNGWPDLQIHKNGFTYFIEVKSENGKVSELQKYRHKQLEKQGFRVFIVSSLKQLLHEFIELSEKLLAERAISNSN